MRAGAWLGISGTPTILLDNGDMLGEYVPAKRLADKLDPKGSKAI